MLNKFNFGQNLTENEIQKFKILKYVKISSISLSLFVIQFSEEKNNAYKDGRKSLRRAKEK